MFKTKSEVDKHVGRIFMKLKSDSEKNRECFKIARFYFGIKEYEQAKMYLANYLSEVNTDPIAWKLMAEISELHEKNTQKAIECYSKSYDLNPNDKKILLKICSCYMNMKEKFESGKAAKWLEKAEQAYPYEKQVVEFKERLFNLFETNAQTQDWEQFLLKGLSENYYNEELHVKLIKNYLKASSDKDDNLHKAIHHILRVEQQSLFDTSTVWYATVIESLETSMSSKHYDDADRYDLIHLVYLVMQYHQILASLQCNNIVEDNCHEYISRDQTVKDLKLFLKFDKSLYIYDEYLTKKKLSPSKALGFIPPYQRILINEIKTQFHYICGLNVMRHSKLPVKSESAKDLTHLVNLRPITPVSDTESINSVENYDCMSNTMLSYVMLAKSTLCSKPNNKEIFQDSIDKLAILNRTSANSNNLRTSVQSLLKMAHRDSCLRYSTIGNWLKFQSSKSKNEIKFLKNIKVYSKVTNIRQTIVDALGLSERLQSESFLLNARPVQFEIEEKTSFYAIDYLSLDYADRQCLLNQSFNLKYLVWHAMISSQFKNTKNICDTYKCLPYFHLRNQNINDIKFGVNNLNICNLESTSLIDMKLFFYSTVFQSMSLNASVSDTDHFNIDLEPYWLQENLCNQKQFTWWANCSKYLFHRRSLSKYTTKPNNSESTEPLTIETLDATYKFNLDIKRQTECAKILEILRLKNSLVKVIDCETQEQEKYQVNLRVCVQVARYLQSLVDKMEDRSGQKYKMLAIKEYLNGKPELLSILQRSSDLVKNMADNEDIDPRSSESSLPVDSEQEFSPHEKLEHLKRITTQYWNHISKQMIKIKQLKKIDLEASMDDSRNFSTFNDTVGSQSTSYSPKSRKTFQTMKYFEFKEPARGTKPDLEGYDLCDETTDDSSKKEPTADEQDDMTIQIGLLNLILNCVEVGNTGVDEETTRENFSTCLKEAISLFNLLETQLDTKVKVDMNHYTLQLCKQIVECLVLNRKRVEEDTPDESNLQDIDVLLDFAKKKVNACYNLRKGQLKLIEFSYFQASAPETKPEEDFDLTIEDITTEQLDTTEEEPKSVTPAKTTCDTSTQSDADITQENINEQIQAKVKEELKKRHKEATPTKFVQTPVANIDIPCTAQIDEDTQTTQETELAAAEYNVKRNEKIIELIETLNQQRIAQLKFNTEHLKEQFHFIGDQFKKVNSEIKKLSSCSDRRKEMLTDFRHTVRSYTSICDQEIYIKQFNVFFWLFQQQAVGQDVQNELNAFKAQLTQQTLEKSPQKSLINGSSLFRTPQVANGNNSLFQTPQNLSKPSPQSTVPFHIAPNTFANISSLPKPSPDYKHETDQDDECNLDYEDDEDYYDEDGNYYDEDEDYYDEDEEAEEHPRRNDLVEENLSQSKYESFQSCNENSQLINSQNQNDSSFKSFTNRNDTANFKSFIDTNDNSHSRSSIKDLEILFDTTGNFYSYDANKQTWSTQGKSHIQVISDEGISLKDTYPAYILCNLVNKNQSVQYNINAGTNVKIFTNSANGLFWFDSIDNNATKALESNRCGAILFNNSTQVIELKKILQKCLSQMAPSHSVMNLMGQNLLNKWCPPDSLPNLKFNTHSQSLLHKPVGFKINGNSFNDVMLSIHDFNDRNLSTSSLLVSFDQYSRSILQHAIRFNQKFELSENPTQFVCTYTILMDAMITDNLSNVKLKNPLVISVIFSSKQALKEFLNLFDH